MFLHLCDNQAQLPEQANPLLINTKIDKSSLLSALAIALNFPDYFGHNWDAAWDLLADNQVTALSLIIHAEDVVDLADFKTFIELLAEAFSTYQKPALWLFIHPQQADKQALEDLTRVSI